MTLFSVINALEQIALSQPNIRSAGHNHLYDFMASPNIKYGVFYITQTSHNSNDDWDEWGLNLFFVDRLQDDKSNELQIESTGKQVLDNIVSLFCENYNGEASGVRKYQPFTEKFVDECAGVYATLRLQTPKDIICAE